MRRTSRAVAVLAATALLSVVATAPASAATYVGLGDSAAAGPLIPWQIPNPLGCWRSNRNFAHVVARSLAVSVRDVSCSRARTDHMLDAQPVSGGTNPPQLDALNAETRIVTLQIGGNDIGFGEIEDTCTTWSPFGHPCRDAYAPGWPESLGTLGQRIEATAPKVAAVLRAIHERAPQARVLVVGYAAIVPHGGAGCWPQVAIAPADVPFVRAVHEALNGMLAAQAGANGATYVDAYAAGVGRDACGSHLVRWVEPTVPVNPAAPLHPNARGMRGVAGLVTGALATGT